jgi:hypothetical protein
MAIPLKQYQRQIQPSGKPTARTVDPSTGVEAAGSNEMLIANVVQGLGSIGEQFFKIKQQEKDTADLAEYQLYMSNQENELKTKQLQALQDGTPFEELGDTVNAEHKLFMEDFVRTRGYSPQLRKKIELDLQGRLQNIDDTYAFELIEREIQQDNFTKENAVGALTNQIWALETELIDLPIEEQDSRKLSQIQALKEERNQIVASLRITAKAGVAEEAVSKALYNRGLFVLEQEEAKYINGLTTPQEYIEALTLTRNRLFNMSQAEEGQLPSLLSHHQGKLLTIADSSINNAKKRVVTQSNRLIQDITDAIESNTATTEFLDKQLNGADPRVVDIINREIRGEIVEGATVVEEIADAWNVVQGFVDGQGVSFDEAMTAVAGLKAPQSRELLIWMIAEQAEEFAEQDPNGAYGTMYLEAGNRIALDNNGATFVRTLAKYLKDFRVGGTLQEGGYAEKEFVQSKIKSYKRWKQDPQDKTFTEWLNGEFSEEAQKLVITSSRNDYGYNDLVTPNLPLGTGRQRSEEETLLRNIDSIPNFSVETREQEYIRRQEEFDRQRELREEFEASITIPPLSIPED